MTSEQLKPEAMKPATFFFGRYTCVAWPKNTSAASMTVSDSVGCGWMVMPEVGGVRAHLDGQHAFGDQLAGAGADDADAEHALGLRIEHRAWSCRRCDRA